jgi:hypothetical protein
MPISNVTTVSYDRPVSTPTTSTVLPLRVEADVDATGKTVINLYATLDPANVAEVNTVVITAGATGDIYTLTVVDNVLTTEYQASYKQRSGDTATTIAAALATQLNASPIVKATAATGTVTVTSEIPGRNVTLAKTDSTVATNLVITTTTPPSGTVLEKKVGTLEVTVGVLTGQADENNNGLVFFNGKDIWYTATSDVTIQKQTTTPGRIGSNSPLTLDAIQTANGVVRA